MTLKTQALPALAAGVLLALGAGGCADWGAHHMSTSSTQAGMASAEPTDHLSPYAAARDREITADVRELLNGDSMVGTRHLNVDTENGVVSLSGSVATTAESDHAVSLARSVDGVVSVRDELRTSG